MTIEYHLIQYVDDLLRGAGRNIGVIAYRGREAGSRTTGTGREGATKPARNIKTLATFDKKKSL